MVSTPADVVFAIAFGCLLLGAAPNPELDCPGPAERSALDNRCHPDGQTG